MHLAKLANLFVFLCAARRAPGPRRGGSGAASNGKRLAPRQSLAAACQPGVCRPVPSDRLPSADSVLNRGTAGNKKNLQ